MPDGIPPLPAARPLNHPAGRPLYRLALALLLALSGPALVACKPLPGDGGTAGPPAVCVPADLAGSGALDGAGTSMSAGPDSALPVCPPASGGPEPSTGIGGPTATPTPSRSTAGPANPTTVPTVRPPTAPGGPIPPAMHRELGVSCTVTHRLSDDPIVFPGLAGAAHNHTFVGNPDVDAKSPPASLLGGKTSCLDKKDASSYWFPTMLQNGKVVDPERVTVYYKSGVRDYRTVLPFPPGFRLIVGDMKTPSADRFEGTWSCGNKTYQDIPASCPDGTSLIVRLKAPSCWDGVNLDSSDHKSHMAWPVDGVCPSSHPVPLPMFELKVPYKLPGGVTKGLAYSSGAGYSFHYDFMNGWDQARQAQLIAHCVNGGRQCNGVGYDQHKP